MDKNIIFELLRLQKTVFSFQEILLRSGETEPQKLIKKLYYYVKSGDLYHIRRGIYAKDRDYNRYEVATKIMSPAYISFETVLRDEGLIFQFYSQIFIASTHTRSITCDGQEYIFRTIKPSILTNPRGIEVKDEYSIASLERAYLDMLYIHSDYYLDNPGSLNWERVYELLPIYDSKRMKKVVDSHYSSHQKERIDEP